MNRTTVTVAVLAGICGSALANSVGFVRTDRFGYDGTITRYGSLADAQSGTNATDVVNVTDRDISIFTSSGSSITGANGGVDATEILGSWWYSTETNSDGSPRGAGWGNTHGNTGVGFMQLYDTTSSSVTSTDMGFSGFDGSFYTQFALSVSGENLDPYSRLSAYDNVNDAGDWLSYQLDLVASGLQGTADSNNFVTAFNQPGNVTGTFTGLFHLTENQNSPANQGFYVVSFSLNMNNWAWDNRFDLVGEPFADSAFGAYVVPLPPAAFAGLGMLAGIAGVRKLRRR